MNENIIIIQNCGYYLVGNFVLPESARWDENYHPGVEKIASMMTTFRQEKNVLNLLESILHEIDIFRKY